ncbi:uncharacterized protein LOC143487750 [Brachyhypopomus gauderio]|uniref:uncharacterized protein LOC143487750 n=1 Tax=Brachyhypopomus gauderio TaxID=698409 RepID=UPI004041A5B4
MTLRHPVDAEVSRLFGPYTQGGRRTSNRRFVVPAQLSSYTHVFCCLEDKNEEFVPNRFAKQKLIAAGLREKRLTFKGCQTNPHDFREFLLAAFPKLRQGGGFELLKISGTTRSRQLSLIPCPNEGYHVRHLKDPQTQIGHATIFIRPLQRNLNIEPVCQPECSSELVGPPQNCVTCEEEFPFSQIKAHSDECRRRLQSSVEVQMEVATECASTPKGEDGHVNSCTGIQETSNTDVYVPHQTITPAPVTPQGHVPTPQIVDLDPIGEQGDWKIEPDPKEAARRFKEDILNKHATGKPLSFSMDLRDSAEDRERAILSFYKMAHVEWASPLTCTLRGDPAIGDGVIRHFFATAMSKLQNGFDICFG